MVVHWDEVAWETGDRRQMRWARQRLAPNLSRYRVAPGGQLFPAHVHVDEAEHVAVLAGTGLSWQDGRTSSVRAGDIVVHEPDTEAHTLLAGGDGLEVLIFG